MQLLSPQTEEKTNVCVCVCVCVCVFQAAAGWAAGVQVGPAVFQRAIGGVGGCLFL